jgi:hypothetical protein
MQRTPLHFEPSTRCLVGVAAAWATAASVMDDQMYVTEGTDAVGDIFDRALRFSGE